MKIDYCIISANEHQMFLEPWLLVHKMWKQVCGIEAKLILIGTTIPEYLKDYHDSIILFEPIEDMHTAFQAQCIRILYPCLFNNKNIIVSDADILPANKSYFNDSIQEYDDNKFISYRDAYLDQQMLGLCYNVANSEVWKDIFKINNKDDIVNTLKKWYNKGYNGKKNCPGWYTDQQMLYKYLTEWHETSGLHIILKDSALKFNRLDKRRRHFISRVDIELLKNIKNNVYSDFHFIRPYKRFKKSINIISNRIIISNNNIN